MSYGVLHSRGRSKQKQNQVFHLNTAQVLECPRLLHKFNSMCTHPPGGNGSGDTNSPWDLPHTPRSHCADVDHHRLVLPVLEFSINRVIAGPALPVSFTKCNDCEILRGVAKASSVCILAGVWYSGMGTHALLPPGGRHCDLCLLLTGSGSAFQPGVQVSCGYLLPGQELLGRPTGACSAVWWFISL